MYNTKYLVVSRVMDGDTLKGFLVVSTGGNTTLVTLDMLKIAGEQAEFLNAKYDRVFGTLSGIKGCSLTDYPSISSEYAVLTKNGISIMYTVLDEKTKKPIGVVAFNGTGQRANLSFKKLDEFSRKFINCNFKMIVDPVDGLIAVGKDGSKFPTIEMSVPEQITTPVGTKKDVSQIDDSSLPVIKVYSFDSVKDNEFNRSCQEKLMLCLFNLQALTPYYYTLLQSITRKPANIDTMGVTEDTLYYDMAFVAKLSVSQLSFVLIHEMMHIAMQHSIRYGKRQNHDLWNIATDLYINSIICRDFGVQFGMGEVNIGTNDKPVTIATPDFGIYIETIGETIDLSRDTPETIYNKLLEENPNMGMPSGMPNMSGKPNQGQGQGQGQSGQQAQQQIQQGMQNVNQGSQQAQQQAQQGQGGQQANQAQQQIQQGMQNLQQGLQNGDMQQAQQGAQQIQQGVQQMQQAQQQSGVDSSGSASSNQMQHGMQQINDGLNQMNQSGQGQGQQGDSLNNSGQQTTQASDLPSDLNGNQGDTFEPLKEVSVTYNGKKLSGKIMKDVGTNKPTTNKDELQENVDASRKALQRMNTKVKMEEQELGHQLEKNAGAGGDLVQRYIDVGLSASIRWQEVLKNLCKDKPKKTFTLANPNQDYMNMGITVADRRAIGKPTRIGRVKIGIDVSGSVSKKELDKILSEINNIYRYYKLDGELIYWSTMVGNAGNFSSLKDMLKIQPVSDGGTDVRCLFDYLAGKSKVNGKTEKDLPKDIKGIFIFTDGCLNMNFADYERMFGKKVVWIITGNPITFKPPFGKVIGLDIE